MINVKSPDFLLSLHGGDDAGSQGEAHIDGHLLEVLERLERKYGVLAQHFFAQVKQGVLATDLSIFEFLEYMVKPLQEEIDSILDW